MSSFEVTGTYIFDPTILAASIESIAGPYLRKIEFKTGAYLNGHDQPLITFDQTFHCKVRNSSGEVLCMPITKMDDIVGNVYNQFDGLVIRNGKCLTSIPNIPIRGIKMIHAYVDRLLILNSAWANQPAPSLQDIWRDYVLPEYEYTHDVYDLIENILADIRSDIRDMVGANKWIMYFKKTNNNDIVIERSIDYRIHDWMVRTNNGNW